MHIAHCLTHSGVGGGQQVVYTLVKTFSAYFPEIRITVILPRGGEYVQRFKSLNVNVIEFPTNKLSFSNVFKMTTLLRGLNIDVLHSHGKGAGFYCRFAPDFIISAKRVHSYHGFHPPLDLLKRKMYNFLESWLLMHNKKLAMVSISEAEEVSEYYSLNKEKLVVIKNVIECQKESQEIFSEEALIDNFFKEKENAFKACIVGRNDPVKNYSLAFNMMRLLLGTKKRDILFVVVGVSSDDHDLQNLIKEFPDNIIAVKSNNVRSILRRCDVLFLTSKKEGCPLVVLEAFCCGKPVIGTRVSGIKDLISDGENGFLCDQSPDSLASAFEKLIDSSSLYKRLSENALMYSSQMDTRAWANDYYQLYKGLINN